MNLSETQDIRIFETDLTDDVLKELSRLSEDWEKEASVYGYRKNEKADIEGSRIFLAMDGAEIALRHVPHHEQSASDMPEGRRKTG